MATGLKRYALVHKNISKANPSLRLAFWSMILTSSLYWIIALLLGGVLLTSCSGSIFSNGKKTPTPEEPAQNTQAQVQNPNPDVPADNTDGKTRDVDLVNQKNGKPRPAPLPDPSGRVVNEKSSLRIFEILFAPTISDYANQSRDQEKRNDIIAKLKLNIIIEAPTKKQIDQKNKLGYGVRTVRLVLTDAKGETLSQHKAELKVTEDDIEGDTRNIMLNGFLQNRDENKNMFFGLSFRFVGNIYKLGQFIEYVKDKPREIPMGDHNDLFIVTIK